MRVEGVELGRMRGGGVRERGRVRGGAREDERGWD